MRVRAPIHLLKKSTAKVHVVVCGFSKQGSISPREIAQAFEWLPAFHLKELHQLVYCPGDPLRYVSTSAASAARSYAEYALVDRSIYVYRTGDPSLFKHVLYPEIGHHVFFRVIGASLRKRWVAEIYPGSTCATRYGKSSAAEDFAECYALYAQDTRNLEHFPQKRIFLRDRVFAVLGGAAAQDPLAESSFDVVEYALLTSAA